MSNRWRTLSIAMANRNPAAVSREKPLGVLFLAQTPPPHHGQSAVAETVRMVLETEAHADITQIWRGGAATNDDIGKKTPAKFFGFLRLLIDLTVLWIRGQRFDVAYLGIAPWAHTAFRDAILAACAKGLANRTLLHIHGQGLDDRLGKRGFAGRFVRACLSGTEAIAMTGAVAAMTRSSGLFHSVLPLANTAADPGDIARSASTAPFVIGCLGNLDPRKGVFDFIDVVGRASVDGPRSVRAVIIGGPTAALSAEDAQAYARENGGETPITVTGWVSEGEKSRLLGEIDVFLYLSHHDLAPVALIEALAHGCVPIVLDIGGLSEMMGSELRHLVIEPDEKAAEKALAIIEGYRRDPSSLERDRKRARIQYHLTFSLDAFSRQLLRHLSGQPDNTGAGRIGGLPITEPAP
ncbi:MAG: glycosyltransferase family 4 protein [Pseudomonadota bacterium]